MTPFVVERLVQLRRHVDHLRALRGAIRSREDLERDLSLHNDVLFSLLSVCQLVIDIAGELSARRGDRFEDYRGAIANLRRDPRFPADLVHALEVLPGFRNILIHEYIALDLSRAVAALDRLDPIDQFIDIVSAIERE